MRPPSSSLVVLVVLAAFAPAWPARAERDAELWTNQPHRKAGKAPQGDLADLAEHARPAVVHVRGLVEESSGGDEAGKTSIGTGFIIHKAGFIVTNEHVVRNVVDLRVRLYDGRELAACVVGADTPTDIALLKVETPSPLPILPLGDSEAVRVGESGVGIWRPVRVQPQRDRGGSLSAGRGRQVVAAQASEPDIYSFFIQTDASINVGNSRRPVD